MSNETAPQIEALYEDDDCLAVNKPAGLLVHGDGRAKGPFLSDWFLEKYPAAKDVGEPGRDTDGEPLERSGVVHRLDRETSGVVLLAKTQKGYESLKKQFQDHAIAKKYLAFLWGEVKEEFGTIDRPIGRSGSDFRKWSAQRGMRGELRPAETYWSRIWTGISNGERFSLIAAEPKTGRTHQIRVHFLAIHHPVVGDSLYAPKRPYALGFGRLALHSWSIGFVALNGKPVSITAPLPTDFSSAFASLGIQAPKS